MTDRKKIPPRIGMSTTDEAVAAFGKLCERYGLSQAKMFETMVLEVDADLYEESVKRYRARYVDHRVKRSAAIAALAKLPAEKLEALLAQARTQDDAQ